ncbi:MAG: L-threonylcarbamoyladenylate synthase [Candidatus Aenigmatarchaeota archaeon]
MEKVEVLEKAIETLRNGNLIVYPTDTIYGIGADATSKEAVGKVYEIKERPLNMPISVLVSDFEMLAKYAEISMEQMSVLKKSLPGPFTFILKPKTTLHVSENNVGFRIPDHWCTLISRSFGKPITTTSANKHQHPTPININEIKNEFGDAVSMYIEEGILKGNPSKVIDLTNDSKVIRE